MRIYLKLGVIGYTGHNIRGGLEDYFKVGRPEVITFVMYGTKHNTEHTLA
jgi:pyrimidine operon attenuation protein/uracil phosphoribosyltransferase